MKHSTFFLGNKYNNNIISIIIIRASAEQEVVCVFFLLKTMAKYQTMTSLYLQYVHVDADKYEIRVCIKRKKEQKFRKKFFQRMTLRAVGARKKTIIARRCETSAMTGVKVINNAKASCI